MTDAETAAAIEALASRMRNRDAAVRAGDADLADPGVFALEFVTALRGRGWRPTPARAKPEPHTDGAGTPQSPEVAELVARVRAEREAAAAEIRARKNAPESAA